VAISVLSGLFAVAAVKLAANFTKEIWTLTIVGVWLIFSPTLTYLTAQFPKNLLGLVFFVLFLKYLIRQNYWLALLFFINLFISHRMTAGLGVITAGAYFTFQMKPNTLKYIIPLGIATIAAVLYLPGVFHLSDLQRLSDSVFSSVEFPPYAFLQYIGGQNIHFFWLAEIIILVLVFLFLGYHIILRYLQKRPYLAFLYIFIPLFVLILPFYSFQNAGIGYRFYLAFSVLAIPLLFFLKPLSTYKIKLPLICLIIAGGLLCSFDYEPETYSPPYDWYYKLVNELEDYANKHDADLIVAHEGVTQLLNIHTDILATNWDPPEKFDQKRFIRLVSGVSPQNYKFYLNKHDFRSIRILPRGYSILTEHIWQKFHQKVKRTNDEYILDQIDNWKNPLKSKPGYLVKGRENSVYDKLANDSASTRLVKLKKKIIQAYPAFFDSLTHGEYLHWKDGTRMVFDDGNINKTHAQLINHPDVEDQFYYSYPKGSDFSPPPELYSDPGRIRYEPFFKKMYGCTREEVRNNLKYIEWLPSHQTQKLLFNIVNGAADSLQAVSRELDRLDEELKKFVINPAGTFNWRKISGTDRMSTHAFGIAIDINTDYANYWRWDLKNPTDSLAYQNQIPEQIVHIFEKHGFIWGGKWYHYDTMHFEFRPELLVEVNN
jgi:hypothetical protein